ncbi:MAG: M15 family metallopeptidase [Acutalibacteraceae bacterium]
MKTSSDRPDFVDISRIADNIRTDIRYYSENNFVGRRIDGYCCPLALLTVEAAEALKKAADCLKEKGFGLVIFDAYRPQKAVDCFVLWAKDESDDKMKSLYYPDIDKSELFSLGFISAHSSHNRGSTVDLSLYDLESGKDIDMGSGFDFFGEISHPDCRGLITDKQFDNRQILQKAMTEAGFLPLQEEWWHFTLEDEPYPDTYFDFDII